MGQVQTRPQAFVPYVVDDKQVSVDRVECCTNEGDQSSEGTNVNALSSTLLIGADYSHETQKMSAFRMDQRPLTYVLDPDTDQLVLQVPYQPSLLVKFQLSINLAPGDDLYHLVFTHANSITALETSIKARHVGSWINVGTWTAPSYQVEEILEFTFVWDAQNDSKGGQPIHFAFFFDGIPTRLAAGGAIWVSERPSGELSLIYGEAGNANLQTPITQALYPGMPMGGPADPSNVDPPYSALPVVDGAPVSLEAALTSTAISFNSPQITSQPLHAVQTSNSTPLNTPPTQLSTHHVGATSHNSHKSLPSLPGLSQSAASSTPTSVISAPNASSMPNVPSVPNAPKAAPGVNPVLSTPRSVSNSRQNRDSMAYGMPLPPPEMKLAARPGPEQQFPADDGPQFRSALVNMERRVPTLRARIKQILKRSIMSRERLEALIEADQWLASGLQEASRYECPSFQPVSDWFSRNSEGGLSSIQRQRKVTLNELTLRLIEPLQRYYEYDIKSFEQRKREFEEESNQFYSWTSRYLANRKEAKRNKVKESSDVKFASKKRTFDVARLDYFTYLNNLTIGLKQQVLVQLLALAAQSLTDSHIALGNEMSTRTQPRVDAAVEDIRKAARDWDNYRIETGQIRRSMLDLAANEAAAAAQTGSGDRQGSPDLPTQGAGAQMPKNYKEGLLWASSRPGAHQDNQSTNKPPLQNMKWHKYWVVLDGTSLREYTNWKQSSVDLHNEPINLLVAGVREARSNERRFCFEVVTPQYKRVYQATSEEDVRAWIAAIGKSISTLLEASDEGPMSPHVRERERDLDNDTLVSPTTAGAANILQAFAASSGSGSSQTAGKSITSTMTGSTMNVQSMNASTLNAATVNGSTLTVPVNGPGGNGSSGNNFSGSAHPGSRMLPIPGTNSGNVSGNGSVSGSAGSTGGGINAGYWREFSPDAHLPQEDGLEKLTRKLSVKGGANHVDRPRVPQINTSFGGGDPNAIPAFVGSFKASPPGDDAPEELIRLLQRSPSNRYCAECHSTRSVEWVSINLLVIICIECSGAHRSLGSHISKVRSLTLDIGAFTPSLKAALAAVSNEVVNHIWEVRLPAGRKLTAESSSQARKKFVFEKYIEKQYIEELEKPNALLRRSIKERNIPLMCAALASRANPNGVSDSDEPMLIDALRSAGSTERIFPLAEVLIKNGATVIPPSEYTGLSGCAQDYLASKINTP